MEQSKASVRQHQVHKHRRQNHQHLPKENHHFSISTSTGLLSTTAVSPRSFPRQIQPPRSLPQTSHYHSTPLPHPPQTSSPNP